MDTFSYSRLDLYETCPRRFYYKYILKWPDPPGEAAILGSTVHKAVELLTNGRSFDDAVLTACMEIADLSVDRAEVESMVATAMSVLSLLPKDVPRVTEKYFLTALAAGAEVFPGVIVPDQKIQGYMDLLFERRPVPVLVDWKTNRRPYPIHRTRQIPLYASIIIEQYGVDAVEGILVFLRTGQAYRQVIDRDAAKAARDWAANLAWEINLKILALERGYADPLKIFNSDPGIGCGHCPWSYPCIKADEKGGNLSCGM